MLPRSSARVLALLAVVLAACTTAGTGDAAVEVRPIEDILEVVVEPDASGTAATLHVTTEIPVACAVVYGTDDDFGAIATDSDMAGGAHVDHMPRLTGLEPATEYRYVLQGSDAQGTLYRSEVRRFTTPEADEQAIPPGTNVAPDADVVDVSSEFSDTFGAANAIDGDPATEWSSDGDGDDAWLLLDLGGSVDITAVRVLTREMSDGSAVIRTFTVTIDDGETLGPFPVDDRGSFAEVDVRGERVRIDAAQTTGGNTGTTEIEIYTSTG